MKKKYLLIAAIAVVAVVALVLVLVLTGNKNKAPDYTKIDLELTNSEFIEYANKNQGLLDTSSLAAIQKLSASNTMLNGNYSASEMYEQLVASGFDSTQIKPYHVENIYGLKNFDMVENQHVTFVDVLNYMAQIASTDEGKAFIGEENSADLATVSDGIAYGIEIIEKEFSKKEFQNYLNELIKELADESISESLPSSVIINSLAGSIFEDYNKKYNGGKNSKVALLDLVLFAVNEKPSISSYFPEGTVEMVNKAALLYERAKQDCSYDEFLPLVDEMIDAISMFVQIENNLDYSNELIQQIYIMYFYDLGMFDNVKMNGKDFVSFANESFDNNKAVENVYPGVFDQQLDDMVRIDEFLSDTTPRKYIVMFESINSIFDNANYIIGSADASESVVGNIYLECSKAK